MSVAIARYSVACGLLVASLLKLGDVFLGSRSGQPLTVAVALAEIVLALWLVLPSRPPKRGWAAVCVFLIATIVIGVLRTLHTRDLGGHCGCMGTRVTLTNWQQLLLSALLLVVAGLSLRHAARGPQQ